MTAQSIGLAVLAFVLCFLLGRKRLVYGVGSLFFFGYIFGIVRANFENMYSYFMFDLAMLGLFLAFFTSKVEMPVGSGAESVKDWLFVFFAWAFLLALAPFQSMMITMVGLRGNLFFLPLILVFASLPKTEFKLVAIFLSLLNLMALGVAGLEYQFGVDVFFPDNAVTQIIYISQDAGGKFRIPSTFSNAHSYAGSMVGTLPLLLAVVNRLDYGVWVRLLCSVGAGAALLGIVLASTRLNLVVAMVLVAVFTFGSKGKVVFKALVVIMVIGLGVVISGNERFQRFKTLDNTEMVTERIGGSVNRGFLEVLIQYPLGNGLGGGGTSIPHFLYHQLRNPVNVENEYARIALEQGIPGLIIWISFIVWVLGRGWHRVRQDPWRSGRLMAWVLLCISFGNSLIGTGLLTAIPGTMMTMMWIGWLVSYDREVEWGARLPTPVETEREAST